MVVALQLVATIASLYLPTLNADIIDQGVVTGDTGYILSTGALDAAGHLRADRLLGDGRLLRGPDRDGLRPRRPRRLFARVGEFSAREMAHFGAPR